MNKEIYTKLSQYMLESMGMLHPPSNPPEFFLLHLPCSKKFRIWICEKGALLAEASVPNHMLPSYYAKDGYSPLFVWVASKFAKVWACRCTSLVRSVLSLPPPMRVGSPAHGLPRPPCGFV